MIDNVKLSVIRSVDAKNGYGAMVVLSLEAYSRLTDGVDAALDEADRYASEIEKRYTHEEVQLHINNSWQKN